MNIFKEFDGKFRGLKNGKWAGTHKRENEYEIFYKEKRQMDWICIFVSLDGTEVTGWKYFSAAKSYASDRGDSLKKTPGWFQEKVNKAIDLTEVTKVKNKKTRQVLIELET